MKRNIKINATETPDTTNDKTTVETKSPEVKLIHDIKLLEVSISSGEESLENIEYNIGYHTRELADYQAHKIETLETIASRKRLVAHLRKDQEGNK